MDFFSKIKWQDYGLDIGPFRLVEEIGANIGIATEEYPSFIMMKTRAILDAYPDVIRSRGKFEDILELGIMKGGSSVLFNELLQPNRHMSVDVYEHKSGLTEFSNYVAAQGRQFVARFDLSQGEPDKIIAAYESAFHAEARFDLIIDDASHNYALSAIAFNRLFPLLRPGGIYALEDWGWGHWPGVWQEKTHPEFENPSLSNLPIYALLSVTGGDGAIAKVIATPNVTFMFRGDTPPSPNFSIEKSFLLRGGRGVPVV